MNPVGWFEIPVLDMPRAKAFYEHLLNVTFEDITMEQDQMALFPMKDEGIGCSGSLVKSQGFTPGLNGIQIYFTAPDLDATLNRAEEKGGKILTPRTSIGEYGFIGFIQDTEGNKIGLHSRV